MISRRELLKSSAAVAASSLLPASLLASRGDAIKHPIPVSGELLPVVGIGSARTFDVGNDEKMKKQLTEVLRLFFDNGGSMIDTSPMYGSAESVLGDLLSRVDSKQAMFAATKVWIDGEEAGIRQMERSMDRMRVERFDLIQIHNLRDWHIHLETLRDWKEQGRIRYLGITTSHGWRHTPLLDAMELEQFDFVQFSYNIENRAVEKRLLPMARDKGVATIINRPYQKGSLFRVVRNQPLPEWAKEFDCASWGQFFLKFIISHPDVTCVIPATSKPHHLVDNMAAGFGRLPNAAMRKKMIEHWKSL